jgi:hypothetical protein
MTWQDSDRALIVETLEQAGWIVGGPRGAAVKLGLKRCSDLNRTRARGHERAPRLLALRTVSDWNAAVGVDALGGLRLSSVFNYERGICLAFVGSFSADSSKVSLIGVSFISRLPGLTPRKAEFVRSARPLSKRSIVRQYSAEWFLASGRSPWLRWLKSIPSYKTLQTPHG